LLKGDKSLSLKPKSKYISSFIAALLARGSFRALVYTSAEVLATKGSLALLVPILFANFDTKVAIVLKSGKLVIILSSLYKN
jgi:hypothetical protein